MALLKKILTSLIIANLFIGTINSMSNGFNLSKNSISSALKEFPQARGVSFSLLTTTPKKPISILQPWSTVFSSTKHMEIAFKNEIEKQDAKHMIEKYLAVIQYKTELKACLTDSDYSLVLAEFDAVMSQSNRSESEHLTKTDGMILKLTSGLLEIKNTFEHLTDLKSKSDLLMQFFSSNSMPEKLDPEEVTNLTKNRYQKEQLENAITKIDELLIKNICYPDQLMSEDVSTLIRAKIKTRLLRCSELSGQQLHDLSVEIVDIVNSEYVSNIDQKWNRAITFPVFLGIQASEFKDQKVSNISLQITNYSKAINYLLTTQKLWQYQEALHKQPLAKIIWLAIEKKVNEQITEELATKEFCKLTIEEQNILKRLYPNSTIYQLIFYNQLLSLSNKLDRIQQDEFAFSKLLAIARISYKLINLLELKKTNYQTSDTNLWLDYFRTQLTNY